jgi:hypothetical protein
MGFSLSGCHSGSPALSILLANSAEVSGTGDYPYAPTHLGRTSIALNMTPRSDNFEHGGSWYDAENKERLAGK